MALLLRLLLLLLEVILAENVVLADTGTELDAVEHTAQLATSGGVEALR